MKKITGKIIAIVLTVTLVFSMTGMAFADTGDNNVNESAQAATTIGKILSAGKAVPEKMNVKNYPEYEELGMSTTSMDNSATVAKYFDYHMEAGDAWIIVPVTANFTGTMWIGAKNYSSSMDTATIYLAESYALIEEDGYVYIDGYNTPIFPQQKSGLAPGKVYSDTSSQFIPMKKGQTYYFIVMADNGGAVDISLTAKLYRTDSDRTIPAYTSTSKYLIASGNRQTGGSTSDIYFKIIPNKTGLMVVDLKEYGYTTSSGTVQFYNNNKKLLSDSITYKSSSDSYKGYFGVVKGKTYYVRVTNCVGSVTQNYKYGIRYSMATATDRNLSSTAKAQKILTGKIYTTLFSATNATSADYYKIYVPKTKTTKFSIDTKKIRSGQVYVRVYKNGKQVGATKIIKPNVTKTIFTVTYGKTTGKATKGTYYIKVSKTAKCSGVYKIKYVQ